MSGLVVNGEERSDLIGRSVAELVEAVAVSPRGIAVARNAEVVPRSAWGDVTVADGDVVEVLTAAQGG